MRFSSVRDINAPLDFVFDELSDFEAYESYAMRIGATVDRRDKLIEEGPGMYWHVEGDHRGKPRQADILLTTFEPSRRMVFETRTSGFVIDIDLEMMALTTRQTRLKVTLTAKAQTLSSRLILQSARLAKKSLTRRFETRVRDYSNHIAESHAYYHV